MIIKSTYFYKKNVLQNAQHLLIEYSSGCWIGRISAMFPGGVTVFN